MLAQPYYHIVDYALVAIAILVNVLMIGIMLSRPSGLKGVEVALGWIFVGLVLPVSCAVILNALGKREWWTVVLPLLLLVFMIVEFVLDYILKLNFRQTRLLWPYLLLYYLSLWGMIGYVFLVDKRLGFVNLVIYFFHLLATWY